MQEYENILRRRAQNKLKLKYIEPLINEHTGLIEDDLPTTMAYLDVNYSVIQTEELKQKAYKVLSISINPSKRMVIVFRPIE